MENLDKYSPDQLRDPAGTHTGGRFTTRPATPVTPPPEQEDPALIASRERSRALHAYRRGAMSYGDFYDAYGAPSQNAKRTAEMNVVAMHLRGDITTEEALALGVNPEDPAVGNRAREWATAQYPNKSTVRNLTGGTTRAEQNLRAAIAAPPPPPPVEDRSRWTEGHIQFNVNNGTINEQEATLIRSAQGRSDPVINMGQAENLYRRGDLSSGEAWQQAGYIPSNDAVTEHNSEASVRRQFLAGHLTTTQARDYGFNPSRSEQSMRSGSRGRFSFDERHHYTHDPLYQNETDRAIGPLHLSWSTTNEYTPSTNPGLPENSRGGEPTLASYSAAQMRARSLYRAGGTRADALTAGYAPTLNDLLANRQISRSGELSTRSREKLIAAYSNGILSTEQIHATGWTEFNPNNISISRSSTASPATQPVQLIPVTPGIDEWTQDQVMEDFRSGSIDETTARLRGVAPDGIDQSEQRIRTSHPNAVISNSMRPTVTDTPRWSVVDKANTGRPPADWAANVDLPEPIVRIDDPRNNRAAIFSTTRGNTTGRVPTDQELGAMFGALPGTKIDISIDSTGINSRTTLVSDFGRGTNFTQSRTMRIVGDDLKIRNNIFVANNLPEGYGAASLYTEAVMAKKFGVHSIDVGGAHGGGRYHLLNGHGTWGEYSTNGEWSQEMVGFFVWPTLGYHARIGYAVDDINRSLGTNLNSNSDIRDALFTLPKGREAWMKYGRSIAGEFDFEGPGNSLDYLTTYLDRKGKLVKMVQENMNLFKNILETQTGIGLDSDIPTTLDWEVSKWMDDEVARGLPSIQYILDYEQEWLKNNIVTPTNDLVEENKKVQLLLNLVKSYDNEVVSLQTIDRLEKALGYTPEVYDMAERSLVIQYMNNDINEETFRLLIENIINKGLEGAWAQGMEDNQLSYPKNMTSVWKADFAKMVETEKSFLDGFIHAMNLAKDRIAGGSVAAPGEMKVILKRAELWGRRYEDIRQRSQRITASHTKAIKTAGKRKAIKMLWTLGEADHCDTCYALNGVIAYSWEWDNSGYHPRDPDGLLECHGFRCACTCEPTELRRSRALRSGKTLETWIPERIERIKKLGREKANLGRGINKGGDGSGNFEHAGRPGLVGGSAPDNEVHSLGGGGLIVGNIVHEFPGHELVFQVDKFVDFPKQRSGLIAVAVQGPNEGLILYSQSMTTLGHAVMVESIGDNIDNYVRFTWSRRDQSIGANTVYAASEDPEKGMDNIYEALDTLNGHGIDSEQKIQIYQGLETPGPDNPVVTTRLGKLLFIETIDGSPHARLVKNVLNTI